MTEDVRTWVHTYPEDEPLLTAAIQDGGGSVVDVTDANAIVWTTGSPAELRTYLTDAVRWVQLGSAGIEEYFRAGVIDGDRTWTAAKGVYAQACAEYVVAMMFAASRRLHEVIEARTWKPLEIQTLKGKTVGIIGAGGIGGEVFRMLEPFEMRRIAQTRSGRDVPNADLSLGRDGLDVLLQESDFVVVAAPLTPETERLISTDKLALMRPEAWLINVARGGLVDTDALLTALSSTASPDGAAVRGIAGAVLDVTDPEPLPDGHPLWQLPNAIITSHTANYWRLGRALFAERLRKNVQARIAGQTLAGVVHPAQGY